ncbi:MAG: 4Fe-4S binding protein [Candidatus Lokiarchaeota archaeon]|nr:4Fe-4S binding protein [Candidatus Lokiarchaeota archaeon]
MEKLFPININPNLCVRCQKCSYSCHPKAIFFRDSLRFVDYNKCEGCLKCVDVCEHNAIEVISIEEGKLTDFKIDTDKCTVCKKCLEPGFCFQNLFESKIDPETRKTMILFNKDGMDSCESCLKCFSNCPNNAIIPVISY